jgi:hypothetical protein
VTTFFEHHEDFVEKTQIEGEYRATYQIESLGPNNKCGRGTMCDGWTLDGQYSVVTDAEGKS